VLLDVNLTIVIQKKCNVILYMYFMFEC